jgi:hypothetical protein
VIESPEYPTTPQEQYEVIMRERGKWSQLYCHGCREYQAMDDFHNHQRRRKHTRYCRRCWNAKHG